MRRREDDRVIRVEVYFLAALVFALRFNAVGVTNGLPADSQQQFSFRSICYTYRSSADVDQEISWLQVLLKDSSHMKSKRFFRI